MMNKKISKEINNLEINLLNFTNNKDNIKLNWQDISIEDRCNMAEELTSIYVAFKNIALGQDKNKKTKKYLVGAPTKDTDIISTMIKIKIFSKAASSIPWFTLNQIINHIRSKGGLYSDVSRDTINRRINRLIKRGEVTKIKASDLKKDKIKKIVHHRSFKYVYCTSNKELQRLKRGELTASEIAPLNTFIVHMKNFISLLPDRERAQFISQLISEN